jgi:hypothetical protein
MLAHEGFPATDKRPAIPPQTWAEWFEWAYGMSLDSYAQLAKEGNHAQLVQQLEPGKSPPVFDYKIDGTASMRKLFPNVVEDVREHATR